MDCAVQPICPVPRLCVTCFWGSLVGGKGGGGGDNVTNESSVLGLRACGPWTPSTKPSVGGRVGGGGTLCCDTGGGEGG